MKKFFISFTAIFTLSIVLFQTQSEAKQFSPCAEILEPTKGVSKNVRGVALMYNIERKFKDRRTSLSVNALHLPKPATFGDYDGYEVFASIPNMISWQFSLTNYDGTNWAGNWDEISPVMRPTLIKVRTFNTATKKSGVVVIENTIKKCSKK